MPREYQVTNRTIHEAVSAFTTIDLMPLRSEFLKKVPSGGSVECDVNLLDLFPVYNAYGAGNSNIARSGDYTISLGLTMFTLKESANDEDIPAVTKKKMDGDEGGQSPKRGRTLPPSTIQYIPEDITKRFAALDEPLYGKASFTIPDMDEAEKRNIKEMLSNPDTPSPKVVELLDVFTNICPECFVRESLQRLGDAKQDMEVRKAALRSVMRIRDFKRKITGGIVPLKQADLDGMDKNAKEYRDYFTYMR